MEERLFRFFSLVVASGTVFAVIVTAGGGYLLTSLVEDTVDGISGGAQFDARVAALNFRVLTNLVLEEGFTDDTAETVIADIRQLYSERQDDQSRAKLAFAIETAVGNFAAAERLDLLERVEDIAPEIARNSPRFSLARLPVVGRRLIADAGAPRTWLDDMGSLRATYRDYQEHAENARRGGYPELRLAFELPLRYLEGRPREEITALIDDIDDLNEVDAAGFEQLMVSMAGSGMRDPDGPLDAESTRVVERVTGFLCEYREESPRLASVSRQADKSACP